MMKMPEMRAVWLNNHTPGQTPLSLRRVPVPLPQAHEALIRLRLAGICGTDLEMGRGYYPYDNIPGHEFVGEVVEAPGAPEWVGQRVAGEINITCGNCRMCRMGSPTHCEQRQVIGLIGHAGVFAEYVALPLANLHRVPANVPDECAVFTEPLAAALEIQEQVQIRPSDRVLLIGAGRLGQLIARTLCLAGSELHVAASRPRQKEWLAGLPLTVVAASQVQERAYDVVVEATGAPLGFQQARQALRPRGVLVLKSTYHGQAQIDLSSVVVDEITLVGSRCGPFEPALRLMEQGRVDPLPLIEARYRLEEWEQAFERAAQPGAGKVLFTFNVER